MTPSWSAKVTLMSFLICSTLASANWILRMAKSSLYRRLQPQALVRLLLVVLSELIVPVDERAVRLTPVVHRLVEAVPFVNVAKLLKSIHLKLNALYKIHNGASALSSLNATLVLN